MMLMTKSSSWVATAILVHAAAVLSLRLGAELEPLAFGLLGAFGAALGYSLGGCLRWRPTLALGTLLVATALAFPRAVAEDTPPLDTNLTLSGIVTEVEPEGAGASLLLAEVLVSDPTAPEDRRWALDRPLRTRVDLLAPLPRPGDALRFHGRLARPRTPLNPTTTPPEPAPLYARAFTTPEPDTRSASWSTTTAIALRERLTLGSPSATALYRALLLGDRSDLDPETRYAYQDTGTAHLLAISGMNLALLGWGLFRVVLFVTIRLAFLPGGRRLGLMRLVQGHRPRALAAVIALAATTAYTFVIAPSDATDRALAALAIVLGGTLLLRRTTGPRVVLQCLLGAAALAPEALLHAGFQLSFAATGSLVLIAPTLTRLRAWLSTRIAHRLVRHAVLSVSALVIGNLACSLATAPLTVAWFGQFPVHGLWVNLVAIPLMSLIVFPAGVLWIALSTTSLGDLLTPVLTTLGDTFNDLIRLAGEASGTASTEAWPLPLGVLACLATLALMATHRGRPEAPPSRWPRLARRGGAITLALTMALALLHERPRAGLTLVALDVGHGDALVLRLPDGTRVLVDTGGRMRGRANRDPNRALAERTLVPALRALGVATLDLLVLTHADLDHVGAALALSERIPIRTLWLPPCARTAAPVRELAARVAAEGGAVYDIARGPPFDLGGATFEILGPAPDLERDGRCVIKDNDASVVMRVSYAGRRVLLTGDIELAAEATLVGAGREHLAADVLKVPHHGSRTSSGEAFLAAVDPTFAIVTGVPGPRPPPHPAVLARYLARGVPTYTTGSEGAVTTHIGPDGVLRIRSIGSIRPP